MVFEKPSKRCALEEEENNAVTCNFHKKRDLVMEKDWAD